MPRQRKQLDIEEKDLWYLVGLIATDGCLSSNGRAVNITAKDFDFLDSIHRSLKITNTIGYKKNGTGKISRHIQISNKNLYGFLIEVGLTPRKSLTLGHLNIPEHGFIDFLRGVIDGDGGIRRWTHPTNGCEQWVLRIYSAAPVFTKWIKNAVESWFDVQGRTHLNKVKVFTVKFGKLAAQRILSECYYDGCLALARKSALAASCIASVPGWSKSNTVKLAA
jgi:hypothetical protein